MFTPHTSNKPLKPSTHHQLLLLIFLLIGLFFSGNTNLWASSTLTSTHIKKDFTPNGCSGFPDGQWGHCCYEHDFLYWVGGSYNERKFADERLKWCTNKSGGPGYVFYDAVRSAGANYWSKAWPLQNKRFEFTPEETEIINNERKLWASLGYPSSFDFMRTESLIFPQLTEHQKKLIHIKFQKTIHSQAYSEFYRHYKWILGEPPVTKMYH